MTVAACLEVLKLRHAAPSVSSLPCAALLFLSFSLAAAPAPSPRVGPRLHEHTVQRGHTLVSLLFTRVNLSLRLHAGSWRRPQAGFQLSLLELKEKKMVSCWVSPALTCLSAYHAQLARAVSLKESMTSPFLPNCRISVRCIMSPII